MAISYRQLNCCVPLYSHSLYWTHLTYNRSSLYRLRTASIVLWRRRACARCTDTKKTLLRYCWPCVLRALPSSGFTCHGVIFEPGKTFISRHILHQHWYTCPIALPLHRNLQHRSLLTVVATTSAPSFQHLRHQRNVCHPVVSRFTRQRRKQETFLYEYCLHWVLLPTKNT
jgi:hypothetical protein